MKRTEEELEDKISQIENSIKIQESLVRHFNSNYSWTIDRETIFEGLFLVFSNKYDFEWLGDLWNIQFDFEEALDLLKEFDFNILRQKIEIDSEILPKDYLLRYKVRIKSKGLIWVIHKNDVDPFPSSPHAHQIDNNIKLDLSNGKCYKGKSHMYTIRSKDLVKIRKEAFDRTGLILPQLKL